MFSMFRRHWEKLLFAAAVLGLVFASGVAVTQFQIFPYPLLKGAWTAARDLNENWRTYAGIKPTKWLQPARRPGSGVVRHQTGKPQPGVTLMTGFFGDGVALRLIDLDGKTLHQWPARFTEVWPQPTHLKGREAPTHDWLTNIHGAVLMPNGDVVFNFDFNGLVRMNACGKVVWKLPTMAHHSVFLAEDGNLWVASRKYHETAVAGFSNIDPPFWEDTILQVSPDGRILSEFSVLDLIFKNKVEGVMFQASDNDMTMTGDVAHLNDAEVLGTRDAAAFPGAAAGDVLISLRNLNLVMIFDPRSERIKWYSTGPWVHQHDADFLADGRISVFDNRRDNKNGKGFGGSRILAIDPSSGKVETLYSGSEANPFFTNIMGKHQILANGNILVTETEGGRAFEVDTNGEIVWEYINRYDEDEVALIEQADRYPSSYAEFAGKTCP